MTCLLSVVGVAGAALGLPAAAYAAASCPNGTPQPAETVTQEPWAQQRFALDRLAGIADGSGVRVAVIDSGVDPANPQLITALMQGYDAPDLGPSAARATSAGQLDCVDHGTGVASIIAARPVDGVAFRGLAPKATIMPIRVSEVQELDGSSQGRGSLGDLAEGIRYAVINKAQVINLSLTAQSDDPRVSAAIQYAAANNVVIVAAAGNHHEDGNPPPYPAMYPHVIGVGAIDKDGIRATTSQVGPYVDLVAPGVDILTAAPGRGHRVHDGTSFAAPFVAATAALMLQYRPDLTPDQVEARLRATADPAPGGPQSMDYGAGVVNPYRAVTEQMAGPARTLAPLPERGPASRADAARAAVTRAHAFVLAGVMVTIVALIVLTATVLPRGIRRRWHPGFNRGLASGRPTAAPNIGGDGAAAPDRGPRRQAELPAAGSADRLTGQRSGSPRR